MDWKALGYLISIGSVFLLGAVAWPGEQDPQWHAPVLIAGMATAVVGMALRFKAHRKEQREKRLAAAEGRSR